jgi:hypothetical protein
MWDLGRETDTAPGWTLYGGRPPPPPANFPAAVRPEIFFFFFFFGAKKKKDAACYILPFGGGWGSEMVFAGRYLHGVGMTAGFFLSLGSQSCKWLYLGCVRLLGFPRLFNTIRIRASYVCGG